jgi:plastocyanin
MDRDPAADQGPLTGEVRLRVPLPIIVPLGALLVIAIFAIGFSRILLSVPHEIAVVIAIVTAANVLAACAVLALRRNADRSFMSELAIVALYPVIVGAVLATMNLEEAHHTEEPGGQPPPGAGAPGLTETVEASGTAFDVDEILLAAGETNELTFVNEDSVDHNISIYEDDSANKAIFEGELIGAGDTVYEIEAPPKPGEAYFQCDVHPNMNGTARFVQPPSG